MTDTDHDGETPLPDERESSAPGDAGDGRNDRRGRGFPAVSRRRLLQGAAAAAAVAAAQGCGVAPRSLPTDVEASDFGPLPPSVPPANCRILAFFDSHEAATVEEATARIVPGDRRDPGAREACVTTYIDRKLADFEAFAVPTYTDAPFAAPSKRNRGEQAGATDTIYVLSDELSLYGFQSELTPQKAYRAGLKALDRWSRERFGDRFTGLGDDRRDQILEDLQKRRAEGFDEPSSDAFFDLLRTDTLEGMFADPAYGGNRDLAGWKLISYPGAQRAYRPEEIARGGRPRRPQALDQMPAMHPGHPSEGAILPLAGSEGPGS